MPSLEMTVSYAKKPVFAYQLTSRPDSYAKKPVFAYELLPEFLLDVLERGDFRLGLG